MIPDRRAAFDGVLCSIFDDQHLFPPHQLVELRMVIHPNSTEIIDAHAHGLDLLAAVAAAPVHPEYIGDFFSDERFEFLPRV